MKFKVKDFSRKQIQKLKSIYNKTVWKFKSWHHAAKLWLGFKYFFLFELLTLKLVLLTNKLVRKYIVMNGKDPDWVAPPPLPPALTVEDVWKTPTRKNPQTIFPIKNEWVTDLSTHPVLKSRTSWTPPNKKVYIPRSTPVVVSEPLQVTISVDDNDTFEEAQKEFDAMVAALEVNPTSVDKPTSLSTLKEAIDTIKRLSDKVDKYSVPPVTTSTEGGLFRRVDKENEE